jgi:hypothetical protein
MNPAVSERVLRAVVTVVDARDSIGVCVLKMARNNTLFSCPEAAEGCGEVAVVVEDGALVGRKTPSLGVGRLVWPRATSFIGPVVLGTVIFGLVWVGMGDFSTFSCF